jgi:hypothetical protein
MRRPVPQATAENEAHGEFHERARVNDVDAAQNAQTAVSQPRQKHSNERDEHEEAQSQENGHHAQRQSQDEPEVGAETNAHSSEGHGGDKEKSGSNAPVVRVEEPSTPSPAPASNEDLSIVDVSDGSDRESDVGEEEHASPPTRVAPIAALNRLPSRPSAPPLVVEQPPTLPAPEASSQVFVPGLNFLLLRPSCSARKSVDLCVEQLLPCAHTMAQAAPVCPTSGPQERTLALLLPALVTEGGADAIISSIRRAGLRIVVEKYVTLTTEVSLNAGVFFLCVPGWR